MALPNSPYVDVIVCLDEHTPLPPMRIGIHDVRLIPLLVEAQVRTAEHVRHLAMQQLMERTDADE